MKLNLTKAGACLTAAALIAAGTASAHRAWMLPSTFTLSGDEQWITVDGAISNNLFTPNHVAMRLDGVTVTGPDGAAVEIQNASSGEIRSAFDVLLDQQGTYRLSSGGAGYFASWQEDGERKRWRGTAETLAAEGIEQKPDVEISRTVRRTETFVTLGAPSDGVFATEGTGLELKPVTHPNDIYASEEVSFQFLLDGAPAEGVSIELVRGHDRYRDVEGAVELTTDADGMVTFTPDTAAPYWMSAEHESEGTLNGQPIAVRTSYVVTFEALPF
jgi:uncharacterized GH25 family protein